MRLPSFLAYLSACPKRRILPFQNCCPHLQGIEITPKLLRVCLRPLVGFFLLVARPTAMVRGTVSSFQKAPSQKLCAKFLANLALVFRSLRSCLPIRSLGPNGTMQRGMGNRGWDFVCRSTLKAQGQQNVKAKQSRFRLHWPNRITCDIEQN